MVAFDHGELLRYQQSKGKGATGTAYGNGNASVGGASDHRDGGTVLISAQPDPAANQNQQLSFYLNAVRVTRLKKKYCSSTRVVQNERTIGDVWPHYRALRFSAEISAFPRIFLAVAAA